MYKSLGSGNALANVPFQRKGATPVRNLKDKLSDFVVADDFLNFEAAGNVNCASGINDAITYAYNRGGGVVYLPSIEYGIGDQIILKKGVKLLGNGQNEVVDTNAPIMKTSLLLPIANLASMVTQTDTNDILHSIGIEGVSFRCKNGAFKAAKALHLSIVNSRIIGNSVEDGDNDGIWIVRNQYACWINWIIRNNISGFASGTGLYYEGSDSLIAHNYASGCLRNIWANSYGGNRYEANQIEVATGIGLRLTATNGALEGKNALIGNYFDLNKKSLVIDQADPAATITGVTTVISNIFSRTNTDQNPTPVNSHIEVSDKINNVNITGNAFDYSGAYDVDFKGASINSNIGNNSHNKNPDKRINNAPADLNFETSGPNGSTKSVQKIVTGNRSARVANTSFNNFGNDTVLGRPNVNARFGMSQSDGYDVAMLIGTPNGNSIETSFVDGENTTITQALWSFKGVGVFMVDGNGFALELQSDAANPSYNKYMVFTQPSNGVLKFKWKGENGTTYQYQVNGTPV